MATFTMEVNSLSRPSLKPLNPSQSAGHEGEKLNEKIKEVNQFIREPQYIRNLIKPWREANKEQQRGLQYYLESLKSEAVESFESQFTLTVLDYSWQTWKFLSDYFSARSLYLEVPDACPGQNNDFMYTWSRAEHYLECEIFGNGVVEFFYRNRSSGKVWGEDTTLEQGFTTSILEKVELFSW
jgi:hypothetical protein